jgi:type VI secretion system protein ImpM
VSRNVVFAGWYGKVPGTGDFVTRRLPGAFRERWDAWLAEVMAASREQVGARWPDAFQSMPAWRFVLKAGVVSTQAWAGVTVPSVDSVGRLFPLTVASELPPEDIDAEATLLSAGRWFQHIEAAALSALEPGTDPAAVDSAILQRPFHTSWLQFPLAGEATIPAHAPLPRQVWTVPGVSEPAAAWLADDAESVGRCLLLTATLPSAAQYCAMVDGRWAERGWIPREI